MVCRDASCVTTLRQSTQLLPIPGVMQTHQQFDIWPTRRLELPQSLWHKLMRLRWFGSLSANKVVECSCPKQKPAMMLSGMTQCKETSSDWGTRRISLDYFALCKSLMQISHSDYISLCNATNLINWEGNSELSQNQVRTELLMCVHWSIELWCLLADRDEVRIHSIQIPLQLHISMHCNV